MPTNEQRRATAKRKLERQLERRAEKDRKRRTYMIVGSAVAAVVVIGAVVATIVLTTGNSDSTASGSSSETTGQTPEQDPFDAPAPGEIAALPQFTAPDGLGQNCQYPAAQEASKANNPPRTGEVPTEPAQVSASMETNQGNIGLQLDNGKSPCTVNSFASLAQQGYFNDTPCHR
ncbi:MAG: peptidylprolyl isomerase, partial [Mycobacterium sp.]|nr:peptidylprolyl isomerase [Mycobacterium sp.]